MAIGAIVTVRYGDKCHRCQQFTERTKGTHFASHWFCHLCLGKLAGALTIIRWKASDIGHLASSAIGSLELVGIENIETTLQVITELSNEIAEKLAFTRPKENEKSSIVLEKDEMEF